jgi:hypothetical protein
MTTIYMAGPINGCTDDEAHGWRDGFMKNLRPYGYDFRDPMVRDYRGREDECVNEIVEFDKEDIDKSDIFVAYCWQVSWGTGMEIHYAWGLNHTPDTLVGPEILLVVPDGARISPWLRYHSDRIFGSLEELQSHLKCLQTEAQRV